MNNDPLINPDSDLYAVTPELADKQNRHFRQSIINARRLKTVQNELVVYRADCREQLTSDAIALAVACLAAHPEQILVKRYFFANVNILYSNSSEAETVLAENEREFLCVSSQQELKSLISDSLRIVSESCDILDSREEFSEARMTSQAILEIQNCWLTVLPVAEMQSIIGHCCLLAVEHDKSIAGVPDESEFGRVCRALMGLNEHVYSLVNVGIASGLMIETETGQAKLVSRDDSTH